MLFGDVNYRIKFKIGRKKWSGGGNYKGKWKVEGGCGGGDC
jgi:hypothetical protein